MGRTEPKDHEASGWISAAAECHPPESATATTGFDERADAAAERNDPSADEYDEDLYDGEDDQQRSTRAKRELRSVVAPWPSV